MSNISRSNLATLVGLAALTMTLPFGARAWANDHAGSGDEFQVSKLALEGKPVTGMELEQESGKVYLRLLSASGQKAEVVDVTRPEKRLTAVAVSAQDQHTTTGKDLALTGATSSDAASPTPTQEFSLWDLSQPKHPRLAQQFNDVYRVIEDRRGYIYVLHRDGLVVIRNKKKSHKSSWPDMGIYG